MSSFFDIFATCLFVATAGMFLFRLQYEDPPLWPYIVLIGLCAGGNWVGDQIGYVYGAICMFAVASGLAYLAVKPFQPSE